MKHPDVNQLDMKRCCSRHSPRNKLARTAWSFVWLLLFRPSPECLFGWRNVLLRCFGAQVGAGCAVYSSCRIWAPWNLVMEEQSCLSRDVDCYCVAPIRIGANVTVSQYAHLCSASHDIESANMELVTGSITIESGAWICAGAFVGPGVTVGSGAVIAARAVVVRDVPAWNVVGGNPAKFIKNRIIKPREAA